MGDYLKARKTRDYMGIAEKNLSNLLLFYAGSYPNTNTKTATRSGEEYSSDGKAEKQKKIKKNKKFNQARAQLKFRKPRSNA